MADTLRLQSLLGMGHLHRPLCLVCDHFAGEGVYEQLVEGSGVAQATSIIKGRRRTTFIPNAHRRKQLMALAIALGVFVRQTEFSLSADVIRILSQSLVAAGVGSSFLKASLLEVEHTDHGLSPLSSDGKGKPGDSSPDNVC
ncbi:unnamed protein product [Phytomonas sp. Hart1]|nr:unnamed protein product [Phytomonas sp. Hart1]|eukprot:CCW71722.1 unnamed protein product [Phytomonas sp. isolate Hart1]